MYYGYCIACAEEFELFEIKKAYVLTCGHCLCKDCILTWFNVSRACSKCRTLRKARNRTYIFHDISFDLLYMLREQYPNDTELIEYSNKLLQLTWFNSDKTDKLKRKRKTMQISFDHVENHSRYLDIWEEFDSVHDCTGISYYMNTIITLGFSKSFALYRPMLYTRHVSNKIPLLIFNAHYPGIHIIDLVNSELTYIESTDKPYIDFAVSKYKGRNLIACLDNTNSAYIYSYTNKSLVHIIKHNNIIRKCVFDVSGSKFIYFADIFNTISVFNTKTMETKTLLNLQESEQIESLDSWFRNMVIVKTSSKLFAIEIDGEDIYTYDFNTLFENSKYDVAIDELKPIKSYSKKINKTISIEIERVKLLTVMNINIMKKNQHKNINFEINLYQVFMYRKRRRITLIHRESLSSIFIILFEITKGKNKILFRSIIYNLKAFNSVRDKIYPVSVEYKGKWYILMHNRKSHGLWISDFRGKYYMTCKRFVDPNYIDAEFIKREWNEESFIIIKAYNKTFLWGFKRQIIYYSNYNKDIGYISGSDEPIYKFPEEGYCTGETNSLEDWKSDWLE